MSKNIYFVRHGESAGNAKSADVQGPDSPLTELGEQQAEVVAKRISHLDFDLLVASTYKRAQQTAEAISQKTDKEILTNELFIERVRPSEQIGTPKDDPKRKVSQEAYKKAFAAGEKYKDGESFEEISKRAKDCLKFLESREEENIVVVTHGMFLRVIFAVLMLKEHLNAQNCFEIMDTLTTKNTGVSKIYLDDKNKWRIVVWNDHAHFAQNGLD